MKICIICPHFPTMGYPCGAADFVDNFSTKLSKHHQVSLITSNTNSIKKDTVEVKIFNGKWNFFKIREIAEWIKRENFDVVDIQYESFMYANSGLILLLPLMLPKKIKKILTLHSETLPKLSQKFWRLIQYTLFQEVIFYSENFMKKALVSFSVMKPKFHLSPFPSNITQLEETPLKKILRQSFKGHDPSLIYLSYFGHLSSNRGVEDILKAMKEINSEKLRLILIGQFTPETNAYHRELNLLVKNMELEKVVTFTERLDEKEVSAILQISDLGILPFEEGASFKNGSLAAYVSHQVPVITSKSSTTEKALLENKGIKFYDHKSPQDMNGLLSGIVKDPSQLESMKDQIKELNENYSWENYIKNRMNLYESAR
ncbi:MAG: glycosyltransferase [Rhizobacter sp.]|nr:glycosyltransferase [Bacteriovorax sp.]